MSNPHDNYCDQLSATEVALMLRAHAAEAEALIGLRRQAVVRLPMTRDDVDLFRHAARLLSPEPRRIAALEADFDGPHANYAVPIWKPTEHVARVVKIDDGAVSPLPTAKLTAGGTWREQLRRLRAVFKKVPVRST